MSPSLRGTALVTNDLESSRELARAAAVAAASKKATDILILELAELLGIVDHFVLVSASNERQLGTILDEVERQLREGDGRRPRSREGTKESGWVVLDYGDVTVHAFTAEQRAFYELERLWSDAPTVDFVDPADAERRAAADRAAAASSPSA